MRSMRLAWFSIPVLNTLFQIFIKRGAAQLDDASGWTGWLSQSLASRWILAAIAVEILCFFVWMNVLSKLDLSKAFPLSGISYVLIVASGWFVFGEPIAPLQVVGGSLILTGVWLIATAWRDDRGVEPGLSHPEMVQKR